LSDSWESGHARIEGLQFNSAAGDYEPFATEDESLLLLATNKRRKPADKEKVARRPLERSESLSSCLDPFRATKSVGDAKGINSSDGGQKAQI
jgi:hypothetical protein